MQIEGKWRAIFDQNRGQIEGIFGENRGPFVKFACQLERAGERRARTKPPAEVTSRTPVKPGGSICDEGENDITMEKFNKALG